MRATLAGSLVMLRHPEVRRAVLVTGDRLGVLTLAMALAMGHQLGHRDAVRSSYAGLGGADGRLRLPYVAGTFARLGLGLHGHGTSFLGSVFLADIGRVEFLGYAGFTERDCIYLLFRRSLFARRTGAMSTCADDLR
jgi:hypothetical protein